VRPSTEDEETWFDLGAVVVVVVVVAVVVDVVVFVVGAVAVVAVENNKEESEVEALPRIQMANTKSEHPLEILVDPLEYP